MNEHSIEQVKIQNAEAKEKTLPKCKKLKEPEQSKVIRDTQKQSHNWKNSEVALKVEDAKKMPDPMSTLKKSESITQKCEDLKENKQKQQSFNTDKTAGKGEEMQSSRSEDKTLAPKAEVQTSYLNNRDVNETLSKVSSENIIINNTIQETTKDDGQIILL